MEAIVELIVKASCRGNIPSHKEGRQVVGDEAVTRKHWAAMWNARREEGVGIVSGKPETMLMYARWRPWL